MKLDERALEAAWLAHDNACPGEHWKKRERMAAGISAYLTALGEKPMAVSEERLQRTIEFVARWAWRTDPPNANNKLTDSERLSAIKWHPTIKEFGEPHRALAKAEAALAADGRG